MGLLTGEMDRKYLLNANSNQPPIFARVFRAIHNKSHKKWDARMIKIHLFLMTTLKWCVDSPLIKIHVGSKRWFFPFPNRSYQLWPTSPHNWRPQQGNSISRQKPVPNRDLHGFKMVKKKGSPISTLISWWFFTNPFEKYARPSNWFPFPPQGFQGWKSGLQPQDSRTEPTPMPSNIVIPNLGFAMKRLSQQN